jgi:hypothetical protein
MIYPIEMHGYLNHQNRDKHSWFMICRFATPMAVRSTVERVNIHQQTQMGAQLVVITLQGNWNAISVCTVANLFFGILNIFRDVCRQIVWVRDKFSRNFIKSWSFQQLGCEVATKGGIWCHGKDNSWRAKCLNNGDTQPMVFVFYIGNVW